MIAHHGVTAHINREHVGQIEDPTADPVSPMTEIPPGLCIHPAQELAPYAAGDHVVIRRGVQRNELAAWHGHGGSVGFGSVNQASAR